MPSSFVGTAPHYAQHSSGLLDPSLGFRQGSNEGSVLQFSGHVSAFQIDNLNSSHLHSANVGSSSGSGQAELVKKKKKGRPRKYVSDNSMALVLTPMPERPSQGSVGVSEKQKRRRPPGSGRKQKLASIGGWMNSSAGTAFCSCGSIHTSWRGGSNKRTGGLNISLSGHNGDASGGVVGNRLIADSPVQVIGFSFIYDCSKSMTRDEEPSRLLKYEQEVDEPSTAANDRPYHNLTRQLLKTDGPTHSLWS